MSQVHTIKGLIDRDRLTVEDFVTEEPDKRVTATEYRLDGEIVRRDVWVALFVGQALFGEAAELA